MSPQHNNPSEPSVKQRSSLPAYLAAAVRYSCASQRRLVVAAPLGAIVAKRAPARLLLVLIGMILALISAHGILRALL